MSRVYNYPPLSARHHIDHKLQLFARGKLGRHEMMREIAAIMERYNVRHLSIGNYAVDLYGYYGEIPIVHIYGLQQASDACPVCGSAVWRYINTEKELPGKYDLISAFCLDCGCFYRKYGYKEERATC